MQPEQWSAEDWGRFTLHAAPCAVADALQQVIGRVNASTRAANRLARLCAQRIREAENGTWPYRQDVGIKET